MRIVWEQGKSVSVCEHVKLWPYREADREYDGSPEYAVDINLYCLECNRTYEIVMEVS